LDLHKYTDKIVAAKEMARVEKLAIRSTCSLDLDFMRQAARGLFDCVSSLIDKRDLPMRITLLCAKGNNSGDGYALGALLLKKGFEVNALQITNIQQASSLCQRMYGEFLEAGGKMVQDLPVNCTVVDALLGTGFRGELAQEYCRIIKICNKSKNYIISIDIASGIDGNSGKSSGAYITSDTTIYLQNPKIGHFFCDGFESYQELLGVSFGLSKEHQDMLHSNLLMLNLNSFEPPSVKRKKAEHKYSIGQLLIVGGSDSMTGAANLAALAALRGGAGIVKVFHPAKEFVPGALEIIHKSLDFKDYLELEKELKKSRVICIGPGLARAKGTKEFLQNFLNGIHIPTILDADALYFFDKKRVSGPCILTPHEGELLHLLGVTKKLDRLEILEIAQEFVNLHDIVLVYKGAPTIILAPQSPKVLLPFAQSAMATAGMGDVLAGIIAAMLLQYDSAYEAVLAAVRIHALAGQRVADEKKQGLIASDCIEIIPQILQ
jgi:ADP-dependent NAD(P)H-hydrate dehydratase / NAD(P)H-hydrate epimerase